MVLANGVIFHDYSLKSCLFLPGSLYYFCVWVWCVLACFSCVRKRSTWRESRLSVVLCWWVMFVGRRMWWVDESGYGCYGCLLSSCSCLILKWSLLLEVSILFVSHYLSSYTRQLQSIPVLSFLSFCHIFSVLARHIHKTVTVYPKR